MGTSHFGLDGSIGAPKTASYELKASSPGTKTYVKTFGRMGIDGGITKHARSYAGKVELEPLVEGDVQAESAVVSGVITRTAFRTLSGAVLSTSSTVSGSVNRIGKTLSGSVASQVPTLSGTVTGYPLTGWKLTDFAVNFAGLDPDSPFTDPAYSTLAVGDKCHYEATTAPDAHVPTMDANGQFTLSPAFLTQTQTFDVQIYDLSDGTFGATATITVFPGDADHDIQGAVQSDVSTVTGALNSFTVNTLSGAVQAGLPVLGGVVTNSPTGNLRLLVGDVQSDSSTVSGAIENIIKLSGGVQPDNATVTGTLKRITDISGAISAQRATVSGSLEPPTEEPGTSDSRSLIKKFINRGIKWNSKQRRLTRK